MSKWAIITDLHFGARNASPHLFAHQMRFYEQVFLPYLDANKIKTLLIGGDVWDTRKFTTTTTVESAKSMFFNELAIRGIVTYVLVGNHDVPYKDTLTPNTSELLLREYSNVSTIYTPSTLDIGGTEVCFIPWICKDNYEDTLLEIENTPAKICLGHLEIAGFKMYAGVESTDGLSRSLFAGFDSVWSGHYHHRSTVGNITYLGTPYDMTWQDHGDPKGFHIYDTDSKVLSFIQNTAKLFFKLEYDDTLEDNIDLKQYDISGTYIKILVVNKTDPYAFDLFMQTLYAKGCADVKVIEDLTTLDAEEDYETVSIKDTPAIIASYVDRLNTNVDRGKIHKLVSTLYTEALNITEV